MDLEQLRTDYDDGYFDKDEQGWCARCTSVRLDGAQVIVELSGDDNGLRRYAQQFVTRLVEVDASSGLAVLAARQGRMFFDLARKRLLSGRPAQLRATAAARPGLLRAALIAEAKEVGSMLSWLDHGGGDEAWARIARAEEAARALLALFPEAVDAAGARAEAERLAKDGASGWTALADLAGALAEATDTPADLRAVAHALGRSSAACAALATAALAALPREAARERDALVKARDGATDAADAIAACLEG